MTEVVRERKLRETLKDTEQAKRETNQKKEIYIDR
jgi:hypothetical protein